MTRSNKLTLRYEVRYVEDDPKWEPADPVKMQRMLNEFLDPGAAFDHMRQGYSLRTNFADYRISSSHLDDSARRVQAEEQARFDKVVSL